jgi:hypothetical protein
MEESTASLRKLCQHPNRNCSRDCCQSSEPNDRGAHCDEGSESFGEFVIAGGNTAELLDTAEEALDQIAALVEMAVIEALDGVVLAGWDDRADLGAANESSSSSES